MQPRGIGGAAATSDDVATSGEGADDARQRDLAPPTSTRGGRARGHRRGRVPCWAAAAPSGWPRSTVAGQSLRRRPLAQVDAAGLGLWRGSPPASRATRRSHGLALVACRVKGSQPVGPHLPPRVALLEGTHLILSGRWIADPTAAPFLGDVARLGAREWLDGGRAFVFGDGSYMFYVIIVESPCDVLTSLAMLFVTFNIEDVLNTDDSIPKKGIKMISGKQPPGAQPYLSAAY